MANTVPSPAALGDDLALSIGEPKRRRLAQGALRVPRRPPASEQHRRRWWRARERRERVERRSREDAARSRRASAHARRSGVAMKYSSRTLRLRSARARRNQRRPSMAEQHATSCEGEGEAEQAEEPRQSARTGRVRRRSRANGGTFSATCAAYGLPAWAAGGRSSLGGKRARAQIRKASRTNRARRLRRPASGAGHGLWPPLGEGCSGAKENHVRSP